MAGVLAELVRLRPDVPQLHAVLARALDASGNRPSAAEHAARAIALYERQLAERPDPVIARQLAEFLLARYQRQAEWTLLKPAEMKSAAGAKLALLDDGSILASGENASGDVYTVTADGEGKQVSAIRLDVLPDTSLPHNGPGRHASGNFQLAAFRLFRSGGQTAKTPNGCSLPMPGPATPISL